MAVPYLKPALTFDEQVELLKTRGVVIDDAARAVATLARISYYRLSAYFYPFRDGENYRPGTRFETGLGLYEFDRRLRLLVMDGIERAEILARTQMTYELAHGSDPFAHADASNFDGKFAHSEWYDGVLEEITRAREEFVRHFRAKYDGFPRVPIWMASELMSFGTLSRMFEGMQRDHQIAVAKALGVHWRVAISWLHSLSYVRNVCAHHGRLWNRELAIKPLLPSGYPEWSILKNGRVYTTLCILRHLTKACHGGEAWAAAARALMREMDGNSDAQRAMGMPGAWPTHEFWRDPPAQVATA